MAELPGRESVSSSLLGGGRTRRQPARSPPVSSRRSSRSPTSSIRRRRHSRPPTSVCAPASLELDPYLRILRWFLHDDETLRVLAFPDELDAGGGLSALLGGSDGSC